MRKILGIVFKQYNIGSWWGAAKSTFGNASVYLTLFNALLLIPTAYVTWIAPWCLGMGFEFPFWLFAVVIIVVAGLVLLLEYKLFTPSGFQFWAEQFWVHENPMRKKIEKMDNRIKNIEDLLEKLVNSK
jgi:ABC-type transport system involved in multi-copper enzyme maturation permease subunit